MPVALLLGFSHQLPGVDPEPDGEPVQNIQGHIVPAPLDAGHIGPMDLTAEGERLLRIALLAA